MFPYFPRVFLWFAMVFLEFSYGFPRVFLLKLSSLGTSALAARGQDTEPPPAPAKAKTANTVETGGSRQRNDGHRGWKTGFSKLPI